MAAVGSPIPDDVEALKELGATMVRKAGEAEAKLAKALAHQSAIEAMNRGIHPVSAAGGT